MTIVGTIKTDNGIMSVNKIDRHNGKDIYTITQGVDCISIDSYDARELVGMLEQHEAKSSDTVTQA